MFGKSVAQIHLVFGINGAIVVHVHILHVTRLHIALINAVPGCNPVIDFFRVLENACCLESPEVADGMTILGTIKLFSITVYLIDGTMDDTVFGRNTTYFIMIVCKVSAYTRSSCLFGHSKRVLFRYPCFSRRRH